MAARLYESLGFEQTDAADEPDCHEVNMILRCPPEQYKEIRIDACMMTKPAENVCCVFGGLLADFQKR